MTRSESALRRSYASTIWNSTTGWTRTVRFRGKFIVDIVVAVGDFQHTPGWERQKNSEERLDR